tara:strand:+ start:680 stop:832 length:153 start_codon:yes stop_codon:yes gene_type:complete
MITKTLNKIGTFLVEWYMLKIYATIMTIFFLSIWIPAMVMIFKEIIATFW